MKEDVRISQWLVYLLRCKDDSLYCGITTDLKRRVAQHNAGTGAKYIVSARRPAKCVWKQKADDHSTALKLEYRIKQLDSKTKEMIVRKKKPIALD